MDSRFRGNDRRACPPEADRESEGVPMFRTPWNPPFGKVGPAAREVQQNAAGVRGVPEILFFVHPPRLGVRGLKTTVVVVLMGCASVPPTLHLDSRFRGNDTGGLRQGCAEGVKPLCRESEGVPQIPSLLPPRVGDQGG